MKINILEIKNVEIRPLWALKPTLIDRIANIFFPKALFLKYDLELYLTVEKEIYSLMNAIIKVSDVTFRVIKYNPETGTVFIVNVAPIATKFHVPSELIVVAAPFIEAKI